MTTTDTMPRPTPAQLRERAEARRAHRTRDAEARWMRQRRQAAIRNGMPRNTPLTRAELAARCARAGH
jgi:hypothetical protein